jgi:hypothetical protein
VSTARVPQETSRFPTLLAPPPQAPPSTCTRSVRNGWKTDIPLFAHETVHPVGFGQQVRTFFDFEALVRG